jgi:uncharacterized membrane protein YhaH (DUF805 family)
MDWKYLFTSLDGRIGRQQWWLGVIVLVVIQWIVGFVIGMLFGTEMPPDPEMAGFGASYSLGLVGGLIMFIVMLPLLWASITLYAKRWHDRGKSGWWSLIMLVPIVGFLWILIELGMLRGIEGANQYGPDPLAG